MCLKKYIQKVVVDYLNSHPHPVEDHTHENYVEKTDIGYMFFKNNEEVGWNTSINGVSTSIYLDIKTVV